MHHQRYTQVPSAPPVEEQRSNYPHPVRGSYAEIIPVDDVGGLYPKLVVNQPEPMAPPASGGLNFDEHNPLIPKPIEHTLIQPLIVVSLLMGLAVMGSGIGTSVFINIVASNNVIFLNLIPMTFTACIYAVIFILSIPELFYRCCKHSNERKGFILPWAILSELFLVGYIALSIYSLGQQADENTHNMEAVMTGINIIIIMFASIAWVNERIDIVGSLFCFLLGAGCTLSLVDPKNGWGWSSSIHTMWPTLAVQIAKSFCFALFVLCFRKSCSNPQSRTYHALFIHTLAGLMFSAGLAIGLEIVPNYNIIEILIKETFTTETAWHLAVIGGIATIFKLALILLARFSDLFVLGFSALISLMLGIISARHSNLRFSNLKDLENFIILNPVLTAGFCCLFVSIVYTLIRIFLLNWLFSRKLQLVRTRPGFLQPKLERV